MNRLAAVRFVLKPLVFVACLLPALFVVGDTFNITGQLGANPVEEIQDRFGNWGLRFVLIALAVTPLRQLSGVTLVGRFRRMLGLFAFFYVAMHFLVWLILEQGLMLAAIAEDIFQRPFITLGMSALALLTAMAATSTAAMRRRLGAGWQRLHNGVYLVGILSVWHYWWQVKQDIREPLMYAAVLALLLGFRLFRSVRRHHAQREHATTASAPVRQA